MKYFLSITILLLIFAACDNRRESEKTRAQDTLDFVPGFSGGHEPGTGEIQSPSYPRQTYENEVSADTSRGIHGANVDTTGSNGSMQESR